MTAVGKKITKADIAVIAIIALFTVFSFLYAFIPRPAGDSFRITSGDETAVYSLKDYRNYELSSNGHRVTVSVTPDGVSVVSSTCPDGICIKTGKISRPGQTIVCIPARIVIEICSGGDSDEDFVVG